MAIGSDALKRRNQKIKESNKATRERRRTQVCRAITCKIDYRKLTAAQTDALNGLFRDAKHLYNDCVLSDSVFEYEIPKSVTVRLPDGTQETRQLSHIGVQTAQGIIQQARDNVRSLKTLKANGHKVGGLKPVKNVDSIPLKQPGRTFRLNGNYIHVERVPGMLHLTGVRQLEGWEIGAAKLIRKASGYYIAFSCFKDKTEYESEHPKPQPRFSIGGLDAGLESDITESDGTKTIRRYPDTRKARYWARRRSKRNKDTNGWKTASRQYRREMERLAAQRKHAALRERQRLEAKYARIVIQDEQIASWRKHKGYPKAGRILQGGILGRLYEMLKTMPQVTVLDKWQPTTAWCRQCGRRTRTPLQRRTYRCAYCGIREDRDVHAALNMIALADQPLSYRELRKPRDIPIGPYVKAA
ncbi:RNA-guided endonuclease InsQ/TnpB family protein [Bifidobacterium felsineum]|uniref:RNA-guided endonuclease InsQ/TnpB family protein n=1 Tax=Bifidobacterium felsineum TaxID=2045440 RepID=UPI001BDC67DC|nr:zinc ribbon domain-containing protein [Bifidobacterium felsineum]MBT1164953.1 transposase [Bifidobacterium felsineum]